MNEVNVYLGKKKPILVKLRCAFIAWGKRGKRQHDIVRPDQNDVVKRGRSKGYRQDARHTKQAQTRRGMSRTSEKPIVETPICLRPLRRASNQIRVAQKINQKMYIRAVENLNSNYPNTTLCAHLRVVAQRAHQNARPALENSGQSRCPHQAYTQPWIVA